MQRVAHVAVGAEDRCCRHRRGRDAISLAVALLLLGPLLFGIAWDVLEFGSAVGLPELGFWATVLAPRSSRWAGSDRW
jgi:hypothetical protein